MNYIQFTFKLSTAHDYQKDLLIYALGEAGFDTFEENIEGFEAFILEEAYDEESFYNAVIPFEADFPLSWTQKAVPQQNWNQVWESNFEPLVIKDQCYVRATFHDARPEFPIELIIEPKMSFGTGHHQTTTMMMEFILEGSFEGKSVLDMGAGTAILAILASRVGASQVTAIDYDPVCYESMVENAKLNLVNLHQILCGSKEAIPSTKFDIIVANINRNILLDQLSRYAEVLFNNGELYLSGFFINDLQIIIDHSQALGFLYQHHKELDNWVAVKFLKTKPN